MKFFIYCRKSTEDEHKQIQSIEDQERILLQLASERKIEIVEVFKESKSAKSPGRELFNQMMTRIKQGDAEGILCWKLDRLARNPIDGGNINWALQQGVVQQIITTDRDYYPHDNVLMMSVEFGMANQFIIDLGKNTKRGMRSKCEKGWYPSVAPQGYINNRYCEKGEKHILKDKQRFPLVRKMWEMALSGQFSLQQICNIANNEWGYRTPRKRKSGGQPLRKSTLHGMLTNPFYYGVFEWDSDFFEGSHEPMITKREFDTVQEIFEQKGRPRQSKRQFNFTGLIKCGECGCAITAEEKSKFLRSKGVVKKYIYYHCTHSDFSRACTQKSVEAMQLEKQIVEFLDGFDLESDFVDFVLSNIADVYGFEVQDRTLISRRIRNETKECETKLDRIIELKISNLLSDEEFLMQKRKLISEKKALLERLAQLDDRQNSWVNLAEKSVKFLHAIKERFSTCSPKEKREILAAIGSTFTLKDGKLSIEANNVYGILQKGILQTRQINTPIEPMNHRIKTGGKGASDPLRSVWLPLLNELRTVLR